MSEIDLLRELKRISKILLLANGAIIEKELLKIATTDERKKIWVAIDGKKTSADLAKEIGIGQRGVQKFLREAKLADLIEYQGDSIRRLLDYAPPSWIEMMPLAKVEQVEGLAPLEERPDSQGTPEPQGGK